MDIAGWHLNWDFLYGVHDIQRLLFIIPILYAAYIFRVKGALLITLASFIVFLPRAFMVSPYPDPVLRPALFTLIAGTVGFLVGVARNEAERRNRLEGVVRSERDRLMSMLERMDDGVFIIDPDYRIRFMNPAMKREFGEGIGAYCYQYLRNSDVPCKENCRLLNVGHGSAGRWECKLPGGSTYDVVASPFTDSDGQVCQLAIFRNITQRKKVEEELVELNKMKSELLSNVSHELRSPLSSIKGIVSSLLQKDIKLDEGTTEMMLRGISEETDRLASLVTNLLNMSKLEAGAWIPEKEHFYIADIIGEVISKQKWAHPKHLFEVYLDPDAPEIYADFGQVRQVLLNLLENAVAYSADGTSITVAVRAVDGMVETSVTDEGVGIPQQDLERIFEKFYRGNQERSRPGGTGLGLAISRALITANGGTIWAESIIGQGSTFRFRLPAACTDNRKETTHHVK
jgi:signal transduction histidine kinase